MRNKPSQVQVCPMLQQNRKVNSALIVYSNLNEVYVHMKSQTTLISYNGE